ncbi:DUF559 domain-containing protein [Nitriliruptoraceae bacterium ZYF776]|nr:DUF559 domain-containing protein [Profundirhabdus halotolerans]
MRSRPRRRHPPRGYRRGGLYGCGSDRVGATHPLGQRGGGVVHRRGRARSPAVGRRRQAPRMSNGPSAPELLRKAVRGSDPAAALAALLAAHDARTLLLELAALQDGQYAVGQARALGLDAQATRWLLDSGRARKLAVGVARIAGAPGTPDPAVTAFLRVWPAGTIGYASAAHHHGLTDTAPARVHLVLPHGTHHRVSGIALHRSRALARTDRLFVGTVAYTSLARTVCDLATSQDPAGTLARLDDAVAAGASRTWLHRRAAALTNGRDGVALVRDATEPGASAAFRSWLERVVALLLELAGLPPAAWNVAVRDGRGTIGVVDALWERWRVIVEAEGLRFHTSPSARRRDAARFNRLLAAGYVVRRFTWQDVVERPYETAVAIAQALREAGAPVDPGRIPADLVLPTR